MIPHIVRSVGVYIVAVCRNGEKRTLRLTSDHLVFTSKGLKPAASVTAHDTLFADLEESASAECIVSHVERDAQAEIFFGLNCRNSVVLADGLKTSTFGRFHTLPSIYMKWASSIFGIERASRIGDSIAELFNKLL